MNPSQESVSLDLDQDQSETNFHQWTPNRLRRELNEYQRQLKAKDQDLQLAAEIGQSLLEQNNRLQSELKEQQASMMQSAETQTEECDPSPIDFGIDEAEHAESGIVNMVDKERVSTLNQDILRLEDAGAKLQRQLSALQAEYQEYQGNQERVEKRLRDELLGCKNELQMVLEDNKKLMEDRDQARAELTEKLGQSKTNHLKMDADQKKFQMRIEELEENLESSERSLLETRRELNVVQEKYMELQVTAQETQEQIHQLPELMEENQRKYNELLECHQALEESRETIQLLSQQLSIYVPTNAASGTGKKSNENRLLFSEIEDKRQALEDQFSHLKHKHSGLVKAHIASVQHQERMKNHISRLNQLSTGVLDESTQQRLEQRLSLLQAENRQLQAQLVRLEKQKTDGDLLATMPCASQALQAQSRDDQVQSLQILVEQLRIELDQCQRELRTAHLLRADNQEKLLKSDQLIMKLEMDLKRVKALNADLQYQMDEIKSKENLAKQLKQLVQEVDDHDPVNSTALPDESSIENQQKTANENQENIQQNVNTDHNAGTISTLALSDDSAPPSPMPIKVSQYMKRRQSDNATKKASNHTIVKDTVKAPSDTVPSKTNTGPKSVHVRRGQAQPECNQQ